jgi:methionine-rich copper-binding protein CopC
MKLNWIVASTLIAFLAGPAASAHEQLVDSSPKAGETVAAGVIDIELEFSNELLDLGSGAEIIVKDEAGDFVSATCAKIQGTFASATVDLDKAGEYQVGWRVVSGDGHPIEGSFSFLVENTSGYQAAGIQEPCLIAAQETTQAPGFSYWLLFGSLGLMAAGLFLYLRPRKKKSA